MYNNYKTQIPDFNSSKIVLEEVYKSIYRHENYCTQVHNLVELFNSREEPQKVQTTLRMTLTSHVTFHILDI